MPRITITELWLKHAHKRVADKPLEFTHDGVDFEFGVIVNPPSERYPKGTKTYFTRYPFAGSKRGRKQSLGRYPTVKLTEALDEAKEVQRQAARGVDPRQVQYAPRQEGLTFGKLFEQYYQERSLKKARPKQDSYVVHRHLSDWLTRPVQEINRQTARERFKAIQDNGAPAASHQVQYLVGAIFNWALDQELVDKNPIHRLPLQGTVKKRSRYLSDEEIKRLLPVVREGEDWVHHVLYLMLLTGQRKGEILKMRWSEILDDCWWLLPGTICLSDGREILGTKNGKPQMTYLTSATLQVLEKQKELEPDSESDWVFPRPTNPDLFRPSVTFYPKFPAICEAAEVRDWKPHDLRRTFVTSLSRLGCPKEIRMAIVNHSSSHVHDAVYDMWEHAPEKMHWMDRWVEFLDAIESGEAANLLPYRPQGPARPSSNSSS